MAAELADTVVGGNHQADSSVTQQPNKICSQLSFPIGEVMMYCFGEYVGIVALGFGRGQMHHQA